MLLILLLSSISVAAPLEGEWRQGCHHGYSRQEFFSGNLATYTEKNFWDSACGGAAAETISRGSIRIGSPLPKPEGARVLDFVFESVSLRPVDERTTSVWNDRRVCGYTDWRKGEERAVTGRECDFFGLGSVIRVPAKGTRKFGVVRVSGETLQLGRLTPERDGSTPDRRPVELDPERYFLVAPQGTQQP